MSATVTGLIGGAPKTAGSVFSMYLNSPYGWTLVNPSAIAMKWDTVVQASSYISYAPSTGIITFVTAGRYMVNIVANIRGLTSSAFPGIWTNLIVNGSQQNQNGFLAVSNICGANQNGGEMTMGYKGMMVEFPAGTTMYLSLVGNSGGSFGYNVTVNNGISQTYSSIIYMGPY